MRMRGWNSMEKRLRLILAELENAQMIAADTDLRNMINSAIGPVTLALGMAKDGKS